MIETVLENEGDILPVICIVYVVINFGLDARISVIFLNDSVQ